MSQEVWTAAAELASGAPSLAALATVCRHRGSLPMARDAKMVVTADGRRWGTVGGGCTEADVTRQALAAAEQGSPIVVRHTLNADLAGDVGLSCGGTVELFLEPLVPTPEMARLYRAVAEGIGKREAGTVVTGVDWSRGPVKAARLGPHDLVVGKGGAVSRLTSHVSRVPMLAERDEAFVEPILRTPRVLIFGAGHVGAEIARAAARVGFYVVLIDDRAEFANAQRVPDADEIIVDDFRRVLERVTLDEDDYVLATTRGHSYDAHIVERTAASRAAYVGMLGSKRKKAVIWKALEAAGVAREALERVRVPIGEPIGADTPAEIAVSVVAELVKRRRTEGLAL
jgi:xanthine dehydrogenase accessory factor